MRGRLVRSHCSVNEKDIRLSRAGGKRRQNRREREERCHDAAANLLRKKDVNLSRCGNAISRMWSPFGWVRNGVLARRETPRQGIRCLLPPDQIFPAAKCGAKKRGAETQTAAQTGGGLHMACRIYEGVTAYPLSL